jgi:hypothetical protein
MAKRVAKFRIGQVVSMRVYRGTSKKRQHGFEFGKIVKISPPKSPPMKKTAPFCYFLDGWLSAQTENDLRALTKKERNG